MPKLRNGSKGGFEPGLSRLRVRHATAKLLHDVFSRTLSICECWLFFLPRLSRHQCSRLSSYSMLLCLLRHLNRTIVTSLLLAFVVHLRFGYALLSSGLSAPSTLLLNICSSSSLITSPYRSSRFLVTSLDPFTAIVPTMLRL